MLGLPEADSRYDDLWFVDAQTGWMVDLGGRFHRTTDGGDTWTLLQDETTGFNGGRSITFVDAQRGWIGTLADSSHVLFQTTDGGQTLTNVSDRIVGPSVQSGICGLWAVDAQTVYGVGGILGGAKLIKTTDGGQTWTSRDLSTVVDSLYFLVDVRFFDRDRGFAVGSIRDGGQQHAAVILTEDGGQTWSVRHVSSGPDEWGWKITFPTPDVGYVAVQGFEPALAKVLKTMDGGATWTELPVPPGTFFSGIAFLSEAVGWVGGDFEPDRRPLAQTTDGGATWTVLPMPSDPTVVNRIRFFSFGGETVGFAGGGFGYRYSPPSVPVAEAPAPRPVTRLGAPIPHPFRERTRLPYFLERAGHVRLEVLDVLGRRVAVVVDDEQSAGDHAASWDGADAQGRPLAAGAYLVRLATGGRTFVQHLTIVD